MTLQTHTKKWDKITKLAIIGFVAGFVGRITAGLLDMYPTIGMLFNLILLAGLVMSFVAAPKVFGGLKTGITALITGAVFFIVGRGMVESAEPSMILGVEFPPLSDPLYIIGSPLNTFGILLLLVGGIMAAVSYLRRVLKAVEGKAAAGN